jgi:hypothetical protein
MSRNKKHNLMDDLHSKLVSKDGWYAFWHIQKFHKTIHWIILGMVVLTIGAVTVENIRPGWLKSKNQGQASDTIELHKQAIDRGSSLTPDTIPPVVDITEPTNNSTLKASRIRVKFSPLDIGSGISKYELYVDGNFDSSLLPSSENPSFTWNASKLFGAHTLAVKAYDNAGNIGTTTPVTVTVIK